MLYGTLKSIVINNTPTVEKEIVRTLRQMRNSQADDICRIRKKLEELRLEAIKNYKKKIFNLYVVLKGMKKNFLILLTDTSSLISKIIEFKKHIARMQKEINNDILQLSEEAIKLEIMMNEDLKIVQNN